MDSNSENGDCLPNDDPDFDESDTESGSFDERLDLNEQRLSNGPSTHLVQWSVITQHSWAVALTPSLHGQGRMS